MLLAFKTTLQLNSVAVEDRRRTLFLDHCIHRVMHVPATDQGPKIIMGATPNFSNAQSPSQLEEDPHS